MSSLVLGSEGFVGKPFCDFLKTKEDVVRFDLKLGNDCRYMNIGSENVDKIYFFAWDVGGAKYLEDTQTQLQQLENNLAILWNVMTQYKPHNRLLFISSQLSYMDTVYGLTKRIGEKWTALLNNAVTVRLWNVYGNYEPQTIRSHVIADFIHQGLSGEINVMTTGEEQRQFVYYEDVNDLLYYTMNSNLNGIYDITTPTYYRIKDVANIIGEILNVKVNFGKKVSRTDKIKYKVNLPTKYKHTKLEDGLNNTVNLYRKEYEKSRNNT